MVRVALSGFALLALAACGDHPGEARAPATNWRLIADEGDRDRIRAWRDSWMKAIAKAAPTHAAEIADAGAVLQPDAALTDPAPPATSYRCRVFKIGALDPRNSDFSASAPSTCRIDASGVLLHFEKSDGTQRPGGLLYPDDDRRQIFLGTMMLSDETYALPYRRDTERDAVGLFERIGANHWRLVLPSPRWEAMLEVIDLVPEG